MPLSSHGEEGARQLAREVVVAARAEDAHEVVGRLAGDVLPALLSGAGDARVGGGRGGWREQGLDAGTGGVR